MRGTSVAYQYDTALHTLERLESATAGHGDGAVGGWWARGALSGGGDGGG